MAASIFTPLLNTTKTIYTSSSYLPYLQSNTIKITPKSRTAVKIKVSNRRSSIPTASFSDPFVIEVAETLEDAISTESASPPPPLPLQKLRDASSQSLLSTPWPSRKDEPFRFTDTSLIRNAQIVPVSSSPPPSLTDSEGKGNQSLEAPYYC
ncbi:protein ABCI7, chloroplastic-like isoform X2 [Impatiens glandulifera]|uniref:protein ABCI7, chloroplastic-like isoform X2 n=1 Tax=Impatiens glandulifera TaxID=253017 RepID=UPI001FB122E9|nr:protein ABCI7, chloroplastic-like isoform X2 [Impatiens glandulifera]